MKRPTLNEAISLINMYGKCGEADVAMGVFESVIDKAPVQKEKLMALWNVILNALALTGRGRAALELYRHRVLHAQDLYPHNTDETTLVAVLNACSHSGLVDEAMQIIAEASVNKREVTVNHWNCIVSALSRAGDSMRLRGS